MTRRRSKNKNQALGPGPCYSYIRCAKGQGGLRRCTGEPLAAGPTEGGDKHSANARLIGGENGDEVDRGGLRDQSPFNCWQQSPGGLALGAIQGQLAARSPQERVDCPFPVTSSAPRFDILDVRKYYKNPRRREGVGAGVFVTSTSCGPPRVRWARQRAPGFSKLTGSLRTTPSAVAFLRGFMSCEQRVLPLHRSRTKAKPRFP